MKQDQRSVAPTPTQATPDDELGMAWWNGLTDQDRTRWARLAGTGRAKDAWELFKKDFDDYYVLEIMADIPPGLTAAQFDKRMQIHRNACYHGEVDEAKRRYFK